MDREGRAAAVQIVLILGGCGFLLAAAIVGGFERSIGDALAAAARWLAVTGVMWAAAVWIGLHGRTRRRRGRCAR